MLQRPKRPRPAAPAHLRAALRELEWSGARRYVEVLRASGDLLETPAADFDLRELCDRRFDCDSRKCLVWGGEQMLIDSSCCARYRIELTSVDRTRLRAVLPLVRPLLGPDHVLQDEQERPWIRDEDYRAVIVEDDRGVCPFVQYTSGRSGCAIHSACLQHGLDPWEHKPLSCSLWPLATLEFRVDGRERTLITAYGHATQGLFADDENDDYDKCACLVDQSPTLPPLYESQQAILRQLFGPGIVARLATAARARARARR